MTERALESIGASWTDLGDWIEHSYSEDEMLEMVAAIRKEERACAPQSNGHIMLPEASEMAQYCRERLNRLKDDKQRNFVADMYVITRREMNLSLGRLGILGEHQHSDRWEDLMTVREQHEDDDTIRFERGEQP
jgi:hypothetical protein